MAQNKKTKKMVDLVLNPTKLTGLSSFISSFDINTKFKVNKENNIPTVNYNIDKPYVEKSKKMITAVKSIKTGIITGQIGLDYENSKSLFANINDLLQAIDMVTSLIEEKCNKPGVVTIQSSNTKAFASNYLEAKEILNYCSDFLSLVIETHEAKKTLKKAKVYTIEQLEEKFADA